MSESDRMSESGVTVMQSTLPLELLHRGKVRDVYDAGNDMLLMVASDRVSAFDVVMKQPIPRKGEVLTQITAWWMKQLEGITAHHLIAVDPDDIVQRVPDLAQSRDQWERRSMLVQRTEPVLVECVIRGYISGSAWKEYRARGTLAGESLPEGLTESERLPSPIFSPATKAQAGDHDENITFDQARATLGDELAQRLRDLSMRVYGFGSETAEACGIILADTKFEFGRAADGDYILIDEVLTPDSSRFWPADTYATGRGQSSLDKQPIRDWLETQEDWDKTPPPPQLPDHVVDATTGRYLEIFRRLTGIELHDYVPPRFD
jgi:phosphoribosylaminoimidazole-succinocarboxamide synthase